MTNADAVWSPDGRQIAFVSHRSGDFGNLWVCDPIGDHLQSLAPEPVQHAAPAWSRDGRQIAYLRNIDGDVQIWRWDGSSVRQVTDQAGVHGEITWLDDRRLVCTYSSPTLPADLRAIDTADGTRRQSTQSATGGVLGRESGRAGARLVVEHGRADDPRTALHPTADRSRASTRGDLGSTAGPAVRRSPRGKATSNI